MRRYGNWAVVLATLLAAASVGISALAGPASGGTSTGPDPGAPVLAPARSPAPQAPQSGYLGSEACVVCHEGYDSTINASKHAFANNPRTPAAAQGCESCHGPGEAHSQDPANVKARQFDQLSAKAVSDTCTACHNRGEHANWMGSQHEARNVSCVSCHSVHSPKSPSGQLKAVSQTQQCATCHRDKVNKLDRSGHMPVREGKMECTSCHNVHGSANVRLLRAGNTINESCASCHAEKRGPFLFEHGGISGDSCATCHDPHGSSNERLLVAKQPFLCQRCHNHTRHPSTIYDNRVTQSSNRLFSRSCVTCHSAIHGSNHPAGATFLR